jgi:hypothetical protein
LSGNLNCGGFAGNCIQANHDWTVPDYTSLCRRQTTLAVQIPYLLSGDEHQRDARRSRDAFEVCKVLFRNPSRCDSSAQQLRLDLCHGLLMVW